MLKRGKPATAFAQRDRTVFKRLLLASLVTAATIGAASAAPITGGFSLTSFAGTYVGGSATATTATGLDFGAAGGGTGNGYGTNGTALVGNASGSFAALGGSLANVADISLGNGVANPYTTNPFVAFTNSTLTLNFSNASLTRSPLGTSITISGTGTFTDGIAADTTQGTFSLSTSNQNGSSGDVNFTFTSNASTTVPEPMSIGLLGAGLIGLGAARRKRRSA